MESILTIDTGATKTRIVEFINSPAPDSVDNTKIIAEVEIATPHDSESYMESVESTVLTNFPNFKSYSDDNVVVLATTGLVRDGRVTSSAIGWKDHPVATELSDRLRGVEVIVENDGRAGALGAFDGADVKRGLYVAIGTGIGGGMIINNQLSKDLRSLEIGKTTFIEKHESFTWESIASGLAFYRKYGRLGNDISSKNPIWSEYARDVAKGLLALFSTLQPDHIVIGGSMAEFFPKYGNHLKTIVADKCWPPAANVKINAAKNFRHTVNQGALILALRQIETRQ